MRYYILLLFTAVVFWGCEEFVNSAEVSEVTYLPKIDVEGESEINLSCNPAGGFDDPGAVATEGGAEIPLKTTLSGVYFDGTTLDGPDLYSITYSAYNVDSIPGVATRDIYWPACAGDFTTSISGIYQAAVYRTRPVAGGTAVDYSDSEFGPYWIIDKGNGVFAISDAIGSFYEHGYGYGAAYAATGMTVTASNPSNLVTSTWEPSGIIGVGAFGGELELTNFKINAVEKTITFSSLWSFDYKFDVVLTQVDPSEFEF